MSKEALKGTHNQKRTLYILAVFCLLVAAVLGWLAIGRSDAMTLRKQNEVFTKSNHDIVAIKVLAISEELGSQEGTKNALYIVQHEHGYAGFIAETDDEALKSLSSATSEAGVLLTVKQVTPSVDVANTLRQSVAGSEIASRMDVQKIASLSDFRQEKRTLMFSAGGFTLFAVGLIISGVIVGMKSRKHLETLYIQFPELHNNLSVLDTDASYRDDLLGIRIYKNYLIYLKGAIVAIDLNEIDWVYHHITTIYQGFVAHKTYQLMFYSYLHKKRNICLSLKRKETPETNIQLFYQHLLSIYPEMLIGVDKKAIFNERKKAQR